MEKAILKTLIYADIFNYPLKAWEIHKWLIEKKASLSQMEKALRRKNLELRVKSHGGYYFLKKRRSLVRVRVQREKISNNYLREVKVVVWLFRLIPWVKLVGVSGSLAMKNVSKRDEIELFVITESNRLWISRILMLGVLELFEKRRKASDSKKTAAGKICIHLILEEDSLSYKDKNTYVAHKILQMQVFWQRDGVYSKYLNDNEWALKMVPNWSTNIKPDVLSGKFYGKDKISNPVIQNTDPISLLESLVKWIQLRYMSFSKGKEKTTNNASYFHPEDYGIEVLRKYKNRVRS